MREGASVSLYGTIGQEQEAIERLRDGVALWQNRELGNFLHGVRQPALRSKAEMPRRAAQLEGRCGATDRMPAHVGDRCMVDERFTEQDGLYRLIF
jgi:hypothetical protein